MTFDDVTYVGADFDDAAILADLPAELSTLLLEDNGLIAFDGGLHIRGACNSPDWHSLRAAWRGPGAFWRSYDTLQPEDIPFAEDCLGDQYLLRKAAVMHLSGETGEISERATSLTEFLNEVVLDPMRALSLEPLHEFRSGGSRLKPGQLLNVYPPFCATFEGPRSYRAIPSAEQHAFLGALAKQLRDLPDGTAVEFKVLPPAV
ncbi:MAG: hypothetical protein ACREOJ_18455 [Gemmatimonadaceae bacterium]